jgi:subtilisin family serine protease
MRVIVQMRSSPAAHRAAAEERPGAAVAAGLSKRVRPLTIDESFPVVQLPGARSVTGAPLLSSHQPTRFSTAAGDSTYLVRGELPERHDQGAAGFAAVLADREVVGVYADPVIATCPICPGSPPLGDVDAVRALLGSDKLRTEGLDGKDVYLAIVDTGVNLKYLRSKGRKPKLNAAKSFTPPGAGGKPGQHDPDHGTMCAFDAGISAPAATLLDHAVLLSKTPGHTAMEGLLSDAVLSYAKLRGILEKMPASRRAMVVSNSWGMFSPTWDFPPGHTGNYSDNPAHPFNVIVASLEAAGADILFAAGNCGRDCPDGRCSFGDTLPICGANSHPSVLSVAGVDTHKARVGYSSQGPGRLTAQKPDVAGYTHFTGSGIYPADGGTSAACPVVAGVIAAVRTKHRAAELTPVQLRAILFKTAEDRGGRGFDYDYGWGIVDPPKLIDAIRSAQRAPRRTAA